MTETNHPPRSVSRRFGIILLLGQVIFIGIFAVLGQYTPAGDALLNANGTLIYDLPSYYPSKSLTVFNFYPVLVTNKIRYPHKRRHHPMISDQMMTLH